MHPLATLALAAGLLSSSPAVDASPVQHVFDSLTGGLPDIPHRKFNPLDHMSGCAPYHDAPNADLRPPPTCRVVAAASLIRHTAIYANDDEWEDYMQPFVERVEKARKKAGKGKKNKKKNKKDKGKHGKIPDDSPLAFLNEWESPINDDNLESVTEPGRRDAHAWGSRIRKTYGHLMPPKHLGKGKDPQERKPKPVPPFKVWSASSTRDVITSQEWIKGAFPDWQGGEDGDGDGTVISLVKVPNNNTDWANSLTPHKICPAFTKEAGKPEAQAWLETYGPPILERLRGWAPSLNLELNDVIAMGMMCGYESVIYKDRESPFCSTKIFHPDDFRAFGYWNDIKYHHIVGYGSPIAPYLGVGWLNTSTHNLLSAYAKPHPHPNETSLSHVDAASTSSSKKKKKPNLPPPSAPPDATHTQLFFPYITHREEPPLALVALGIWNTTSLPTDRMDPARKWKTSHLLPFLGHVTLERLACAVEEFDGRPRSSNDDDDDEEEEGETVDYIRIMVNGAPQQLEHCRDGPGGMCEMGQFGKFVEERVETYKDREGACEKKE